MARSAAAVTSALIKIICHKRQPRKGHQLGVACSGRPSTGGRARVDQRPPPLERYFGSLRLPDRCRLEVGVPWLALAAGEVGLDLVAASVRVLGPLEPFWIPVSGCRVTPYLAFAARRPELTRSLDEVASIVRAPLDAFLPDAPIEVVETTVRDFALRYGAYPVAGHRIWGATARILGQLGTLLS